MLRKHQTGMYMWIRRRLLLVLLAYSLDHTVYVRDKANK